MTKYRFWADFNKPGAMLPGGESGTVEASDDADARESVAEHVREEYGEVEALRIRVEEYYPDSRMDNRNGFGPYHDF